MDTRTLDQRMPEEKRRRQGAFFTPKLWVDEAHRYVEGVLGKTWRDDCIVWDPACGTGNLTRDYGFGDLILTTAEKPDVDVIVEQGYNAGAGTSVAQYDFLNPGVDSPFLLGKNVLPYGIHEQLQRASKAGKRLVFFMNPPYGTAANAGTEEGSHKAGIAVTAVNAAMKRAKLGAPSQQLYAQFLYQCATVAREYGFQEYTVATFSIHTFMCSGSYRPFRNWWYGKHEFKSGFLFQASHFADVSGRWGVAFTVWNSPGRTDATLLCPVDLKDVKDFGVVTTGVKSVYNSDGREASDWLDKNTPLGEMACDAPTMRSGLNVCETSDPGSRWCPGALGLLYNDSNSLLQSATVVFFLSSKSTRARARALLPANWRRAIALYGARKLVLEDWVNQKDEYLAPTAKGGEGTPEYEQWVNDCHVYALLHPSNNCTAMRNVQYKNKTWTIHNHFFWLGHADALAALDTKDTVQLYRDCKQHPAKDVFGNVVESTPDPYMAYVLSRDGGTPLYPDAQEVLDALRALWLKSLPLRESYAAGRPELHLGAWDAGVYQLKHLWRDLFPEEWKALQAAYKALAKRLAGGVYEYGFLLDTTGKRAKP